MTGGARMLTRREWIAASTGSLLCSAFGARAAAGVAAGDAPQDPLISLPGKSPLIKRTFRPPNFETPLAQMRGEFTANEAFFVRYHLALIPQVDAQAWRLRLGGRKLQWPREPPICAV